MKRRFLGLVYLLSTKEKPILNTQTVAKMVNRIPCEQELFFKIDSAEKFVMN
jgi:hypothetical protein